MRKPVQNFILTLMLLATITVKAQHNIDSVDAQKRAVEYFLMEATGLEEQERLDESFEFLEYCRELDPESAAIQYLSSPYHFAMDNDSIVLEMLRNIVENNPDNEAYCEALVEYYYNRSDWQSAIAVYEKLVETAKSKEDIYMALYSLYLENGDYEKALSTLDKISMFIGNTTNVMLQKIHMYLCLGRNDEAIELAKKMIDENPGDKRSAYLLAGTYEIAGNNDMAEETYLQILKEDPDDITAISSLVKIYAQNEKMEKYETLMKRLIRSDKLDLEKRMEYLSRHLIYLNYTDSIRAKTFVLELTELPFYQLEHNEFCLEYLKYIEAPAEDLLPILDKIVELDPENINAIIMQLVYAIERTDIDAVLKYSDEALLYLPHVLDLYYYKGLSYYILNDKEKSLEVLKQGIAAANEESSPSTISMLYAFVGNIYNDLEMNDKCYAAYDSALVYDPYNMEVLNNYAYFLSLDGKELQKALDMSKKTLDEEPQNATYLDTYSWILFKMERYEEAKAYAEKILSLDTALDYVVLHHIGDIYAKCGDIDKAVIYWQEARKTGDETKILEKKIRKRRYYRGAKY